MGDAAFIAGFSSILIAQFEIPTDWSMKMTGKVQKDRFLKYAI